jgi:hypothetical protein
VQTSTERRKKAKMEKSGWKFSMIPEPEAEWGLM